MIDYEQAGELLGLAAARDQRTVGDADILAWSEDLTAAGITYDDAKTAIGAFYQEMARRPRQDRYRATPIDLIDIARRQRRDRLANLRYDGDPDETTAQFLARLRGRIAAVADGRIDPDAGLRALGPGTPAQQKRMVRALAGVGRAIPAEEQPDGGEPATSRRVARLGPLSVRCPTCQAPIGRKCRAGTTAHPRRPHRDRVDASRAAAGQPVTEREDPAEIERRRAASARYLAEQPTHTDTERTAP